jgi:hypothetical protein
MKQKLRISFLHPPERVPKKEMLMVSNKNKSYQKTMLPHPENLYSLYIYYYRCARPGFDVVDD